jgi:hypothetical protein
MRIKRSRQRRSCRDKELHLKLSAKHANTKEVRMGVHIYLESIAPSRIMEDAVKLTPLS